MFSTCWLVDSDGSVSLFQISWKNCYRIIVLEYVGKSWCFIASEAVEDI